VSQLASLQWTQTPNQKSREMVIELARPPVTDTLTLETDNGDNPALELSNFRGYYAVTRLIFKAPADSTAPTWVYYGNRETSAPHYDVALVANELLRSERVSASLGVEEVLNGKGQADGEPLTGATRYVFWGVLALVVIGLLAVLARFVPKAPEQSSQ
jgi:hypothetical protein